MIEYLQRFQRIVECYHVGRALQRYVSDIRQRNAQRAPAHVCSDRRPAHSPPERAASFAPPHRKNARDSATARTSSPPAEGTLHSRGPWSAEHGLVVHPPCTGAPPGAALGG